jgi:hypothetical protein
LLLLNGRPLLRCLYFVADLVIDGDVASATLFACSAVEAALPALFAGERLLRRGSLGRRGGRLGSRRGRRRCRVGLARLLGGSSRQALSTAFFAGERLSRCGRFFSSRRRARNLPGRCRSWRWRCWGGSGQGGYRGLYGRLGLCSGFLLETAGAAFRPGQRRLGYGLLGSGIS